MAVDLAPVTYGERLAFVDVTVPGQDLGPGQITFDTPRILEVVILAATLTAKLHGHQVLAGGTTVFSHADQLEFMGTRLAVHVHVQPGTTGLHQLRHNAYRIVGRIVDRGLEVHFPVREYRERHRQPPFLEFKIGRDGGDPHAGLGVFLHLHFEFEAIHTAFGLGEQVVHTLDRRDGALFTTDTGAYQRLGLVDRLGQLERPVLRFAFFVIGDGDFSAVGRAFTLAGHGAGLDLVAGQQGLGRCDITDGFPTIRCLFLGHDIHVDHVVERAAGVSHSPHAEDHVIPALVGGNLARVLLASWPVTALRLI